MGKSEQLFNSLIKRGRVPFGEKEIKNIKILKTKDKRWNFVCQIPGGISKHCTCRELVAIESGLWQFVCEKGMVDREHKRPAYRIKESAFTDEPELEQFLLDNIKV